MSSVTYTADRMARIKTSPTIAVTKRAADLRAQGQDVIGLGVGEPDFPTPDHIKEAAIQAIYNGKTKYTAVGGTPDLKKAIVEKFRKENEVVYTPDEIIVSTGGKQVIFNAFMASINPGDEVIIPAPYWVSYPDMAVMAEGHPVFVRCSQEDHFKLKPADLDAAITEKTKWLILNSPSNPTGMMYSEDELISLAEVLRKHPHVLIMCDDIYEHIIFEGRKFFTLAQVAPDLKDRILTVNGMSKGYSMTGWRIGFAGGPEPLIKAMHTIQSQSTSNPNSVAQEASIEGLTSSKSFMKERTETFQYRRDQALKILEGAKGISCLTPEGAFYLYPSCAGIIGKRAHNGQQICNDTDFATYLLDAVGVAVVPGIAFGLSPHFRLSYATDTDVLTEACNRIVKAVNMLQS